MKKVGVGNRLSPFQSIADGGSRTLCYQVSVKVMPNEHKKITNPDEMMMPDILKF